MGSSDGGEPSGRRSRPSARGRARGPPGSASRASSCSVLGEESAPGPPRSSRAIQSSCCSYAPRAEEQEGDHGSDVWRQVLAQPLDRFAAEEALSDAALILGWLLDERARPRREPLRTVTEWLTPARGRAASRSIGQHGAALASP